VLTHHYTIHEHKNILFFAQFTRYARDGQKSTADDPFQAVLSKAES